MHYSKRRPLNLLSDIQCPNGTEYRVCGPSCQTSCGALSASPDCRDVCIEGCFCPDGTVKDYEGNCVKPDECPCERDGQYYNDGDIIDVDCGVW